MVMIDILTWCHDFYFYFFFFFWIWNKGGDADMLFFIWYILYYILGLANWNEERKQLQFCITNKTMPRGTSFLPFLALFCFLLFFFLFCVYSWFSFLFLISIPTSHQMRFMIVMSHFFSLFNLLSLHYYSPLPDFLLLISVGRKKHLPWCWYPTLNAIFIVWHFGFGIGLDWLERQKKSKKAKKNQLQSIHSLFFIIVYIPPHACICF